VNTDGLAALDATAQAALVRAGELKPVELVEAAIARVEATNPTVNAVIHERFERALDEATDPPDGPFRGVPIVVKDHDGPLAGEPYHHGNRLLRALGATADHDSWLIARLKEAGFVVVGKTNTPELGLLPTTEPTAYGATRNPWDLGRSSGGSSGGTAAAVASGMVALGHGGDGGGSIRIPASMCGLFGLKPTRGRVSLGPDAGEEWSGLVVRHVITRTVRDSAAVLDLLAGPMTGDPYTAAPPVRPFAREVGREGRRLRVGVRRTAPGGLAEVAPACSDAVDDAAELLQLLGHEVVTDVGPDALDDLSALAAFMVIQATAVARDVTELSVAAGRPVSPEDVESLTWELHERGRAITAAGYIAGCETARAWSRRVLSWWERADGFDLLLTPTVAEPPPLLGEIAADGPESDRALERLIPFGVFTAPFNITGQPATTLPIRVSAGLPIGVQLVAAAGREDLLLRIAGELEDARPWPAIAPALDHPK
jgi:amidase